MNNSNFNNSSSRYNQLNDGAVDNFINYDIFTNQSFKTSQERKKKDQINRNLNITDNTQNNNDSKVLIQEDQSSEKTLKTIYDFTSERAQTQKQKIRFKKNQTNININYINPQEQFI